MIFLSDEDTESIYWEIAKISVQHLEAIKRRVDKIIPAFKVSEYEISEDQGDFYKRFFYNEETGKYQDKQIPHDER
jgi:hypothetical protein